MISIAINIVLCLSFMCYVNYKGRLNVFSVCLLLFYIFVLIGSFFCLFLDLYTLNNNLYSVFIFTFQYLICVYPFVRNNYNVLDVVVPSNKRITWYYIISSLLFVFFIVSYLSRSIPILLLGNYHDVYVEMRGDDASLYLNKFEYILLQFVSYFTIPSFCVSFALISRGFLFKGGVLILLSVFSSIIFSVFMASRTDLFQVFILLFVVCILGYLWYNATPSRLMMGDAGSRAMGIFISLAVLKTGSPFLFLLVALILILDGGLGLVKVALLRFLKIHIFANTTMPLHDHVRKKIGWSNTQTVFRFAIIQIVISIATVYMILI